jgi:hypothetical protein
VIRVSVVGLVTSLHAECLRNFGSIPSRNKRQFFSPKYDTGSEAHPESYLMGTGGGGGNLYTGNVFRRDLWKQDINYHIPLFLFKIHCFFVTTMNN